MSVDITSLPNGITVLTHHMPHLETVALGIWVKAGARDENPEENGIAHFLEHMAFKGTERRTARDIAEEIESAGGEINAATGMETTTYYARVLKNDWQLALDILADIFVNSTLDQEELEHERDVILQEIAAANDQPDDLVFDLAQAASFGDHPLGRSILGTHDLIGAVSRDQIMAWRNRHYMGARIVVAAAGNIDHQAFAVAAEKLLGGVTSGAPPSRLAPGFVPSLRTVEKPLDQAHVVLTFPAPSYRDPDIYTLQVMSNLLGGGMSSRLFQEVREKRGLCYSVFSFGSAYEDAGQMGVYAATSPEHTNELIELTSDIMMSVTREVTDAEVARAKAQLKSSLVMNLESASSRADQIARQYLAFGHVPAIGTLVSKIEAVTTGQVRDLADRLFRQKAPGFSAVGHISQMVGYDTIARHLREAAMAFLRSPFSSDPPPILRDDRVTLRSPEMGDFDQWAALRFESREFLAPWEPSWPANDLTRSAFRSRVRQYWRDIDDDAAYPYFIFDRTGHRLLGALTLSNVRRGVAQTATLGYWMGAPFAGQGYMTAAARLILSFAYGHLGLHRVEAACLPHNAPSIALLHRHGFEQEGYARAYLKIAGKWSDHLLFARVAD